MDKKDFLSQRVFRTNKSDKRKTEFYLKYLVLDGGQQM